MGRSTSFARSNVLESALSLFWLRGFSAASLRQLENTTGLNPGSIYYHFTNKEQLFLAVLQHYIDSHLHMRINKNLSSGDPITGLRRFITSGYRNSQENIYRNCCFLASTCSDLCHLPPLAAELINNGLGSILSGFKRQLARALKNELIRVQAPLDELAEELLHLYLSLQLLAKARPNQQQLDAIVNRSLKTLLQPKSQ
ncbi:MAG: TetR/AcrR family transcriptional regulator [Endozoicomonas sp. (ex Botrylloides leachii)]|nr:TetR/AcrR family transcriptional regulator [Endozoicomonas sp. (ex Botrylloides leachii)]